MVKQSGAVIRTLFLMVLLVLGTGCEQFRFGALPRPAVQVHAGNVMTILACLGRVDARNRQEYEAYTRTLESRPVNPEPIYADIAPRASRFDCGG